MSDQPEVLIVDDNQANVVFLSQILENHGYRFRTANNGKDAMAALQDKRPDLVLLDIMMPRKSGISVFKEMKRNPGLEKIPVIIVTGASGATGVQMQTGAQEPKGSYGDDFARDFGAFLRNALDGLTPEGLVEKPVDPAVLAQKIRELVS